MEIAATSLPGVMLVKPRVFGDGRGYFFESFNRRAFAAAGISFDVVQSNESGSRYGVVRGLHYQKGECAQGKLVRVVEGRVLDVALDIRKGSASYGRHVAVELSAEDRWELFIPRGFAHGFAVLSPTARFVYECDNFYAPQAEGTIRCDDPEIGIDWRIPGGDMILSEKDAAGLPLRDIEPWEN